MTNVRFKEQKVNDGFQFCKKNHKYFKYAKCQTKIMHDHVWL